MSSTLTVQEKTKQVLDALYMTGINAKWVAAFTPTPALFREFLAAHRRTVSRYVHPDVLDENDPQVRDLRGLASPYLTAVETVLALSDDELRDGFRLYADRYGAPRVEILDMLQKLKSEQDGSKRAAERDAAGLALERERLARREGELPRLFAGFYAGHFDGFAPYPVGVIGGELTLPLLRGRYLSTAIYEPAARDEETPLEAGNSWGYVSPTGDLYVAGGDAARRLTEQRAAHKEAGGARFFSRIEAELPPLLASEAATALRGKNVGKRRPDARRGRVIGFTNTDQMEEIEDFASLPMLPGGVREDTLTVDKLARLLSRRLCAREQLTGQELQTTEGAARALRIAPRRPCVVAVGVEPSTDTFRLTIFPVAAILPKPAKPTETKGE